MDKCAWPGCKEESNYKQTIPAFKQNKDKWEQIPNTGVPIPLCKYHMLITTSAPCRAIQVEGKEGFMFDAPLMEVMISEITLSAMIITGRMQKILNAKIEADKKVENEHKKQAEDKAEKQKPTEDTNSEKPAKK